MYAVNNWALMLALPAALLPLVIHILMRARAVRVPASTIQLVREVASSGRRKRRLRDVVIVGLRMIAMGALALAFARPILGEPPAAESGGGVRRVVVLDVSQSMSAGSPVSPFDRGRDAAARLLRPVKGLQANLILAGATARAMLAEPSAVLGGVREELGSVRPTPEKLDAAGALTTAVGQLSPAPGNHARRELVVISDFQERDWTGVLLPEIPEGIELRLITVAASEATPNMAVTSVEMNGGCRAGIPTPVTIEIWNGSAHEQVVRAEVAAGNEIKTLEVACPGFESSRATAYVTLESAGWHEGQVRLAGNEDVLPTDDTRWFVAHAREAPRVGFVTREDPDDPSMPGFLLKRGLLAAMGAEASAALSLRHIHPGVPPPDLNVLDAIVLYHPGMLSNAWCEQLAGHVRQELSVLYVAAGVADVGNLDSLTSALGPDVRLPVRFAHRPAAKADQPRRLGAVRADVRPFAVFGDRLPGLIDGLRFVGGLDSTPVGGGMSRDVLAAYEDGPAFIVHAQSEGGSLVIMNVDLERSELATSPAFVPLLAELLASMLDDSSGTRVVACGNPFEFDLTAWLGSATRARIVGPGEREMGAPLSRGGRRVWEGEGPSPPGVYRVEADGATVFAAATVIPREESDLRTVEPALVSAALKRGDSYQSPLDARDVAGRDRTCFWLALAVLTCMLAEIVILRQ